MIKIIIIIMTITLLVKTLFITQKLGCEELTIVGSFCLVTFVKTFSYKYEQKCNASCTKWKFKFTLFCYSCFTYVLKVRLITYLDHIWLLSIQRRIDKCIPHVSWYNWLRFDMGCYYIHSHLEIKWYKNCNLLRIQRKASLLLFHG